MSSFIDKAREQAEDLIGKAKPYLDKAKEQAEDLVEKAKPLADKAREQAGDLVDKARPVAASAAEKIGDGLDKATGGRYSEKIDGVSDKVEGALRGPGAPGAKDAAAPEPAAEADIADIAVASFDPAAATSTGQSAAAADLIDAEIVDEDPDRTV